MPDSLERELVARCRQGDESAFRDLVDRYSPMVLALAARLVTPQRADDIAQEVFLRVHRGLAYFRGDAKLSTWIYRITANVAAEARGRERPHDVSLDDQAGPGATYGGEDRQFSDVELRDRLAKAMARLPPHYRVLVHGHYVKGVKYEALAAALGLPIGTVKTHLYRAKRLLREALEGDLA
ncbi:MAG: RNA polymerase sigma factor [Vicinamibacterales bacterium]